MPGGAIGLPKVTAAPFDRRAFIGGSDARIIMGSDESALLRLWQEKRGEIEPEDLSGNLIVQLGLGPKPSTGIGTSGIPGKPLNAFNTGFDIPCRRMGATLDGMVAGSGAVFEAKFMLPWSFSEEAAAEKHMPRSKQYAGDEFQNGGALGNYRRWQVGRNFDLGRSALPASPADSGEEILALRGEAASPLASSASSRREPASRRCGSST